MSGLLRVFILIGGMAFGHGVSAQTGLEWTVALKHDREGTAITGSSDALISAIRRGADVKINWGWKDENRSLEHTAEPIWLAIINDQTVMAQLHPQVLARLDFEVADAAFGDDVSLGQEWRVTITSDGKFDAVWIDRKTLEVSRRLPQRHILTWYVRGGGGPDVPMYEQ